MSNMYQFRNLKTWNPLAGECPHKCRYCFVKDLKKRFPALNKKYSGEIRLDEKAMKMNLGKNNFWFVCSCNDLFADNVPSEFIKSILNKCNKFIGNKYLFQTKNPTRFLEYEPYFDFNHILCTTIETNKKYTNISLAPVPYERYRIFAYYLLNLKKMITIEPIIDYDLDVIVKAIKKIKPYQTNIGADSKDNNLPEPPKEKVLELIHELKKFTKVCIKNNLRRIIGKEYKEGYVE